VVTVSKVIAASPTGLNQCLLGSFSGGEVVHPIFGWVIGSHTIWATSV
jgi:hypothetical protein